VSRRAASLALTLCLTAAVAAQCGSSASGDPFGHCPAGTTRVRDVTRTPGRQWVCAR
jgi:hypothetical protein